jgi:hypothetical protein
MNQPEKYQMEELIFKVEIFEFDTSKTVGVVLSIAIATMADNKTMSSLSPGWLNTSAAGSALGSSRA